MLKFPLSPTAIKTYQKCPWQFHLKYNEKALPYVQSPAAARGDVIHLAMETAIKHNEPPSWEEPEATAVMRKFYNTVRALEGNGWQVKTEHSVAMDAKGQLVDYKDKAALLRCRIDLLATHPDKKFIIVMDWKTGKVYPADNVQLVVNAMCLQAMTGQRDFKLFFAYIDQDKVVDLSLTLPDFRYPDYKAHMDTLPTAVAGLYWTVNQIEESYKDGLWVKKQNYLCKWCGATRIQCPLRP